MSVEFDLRSFGWLKKTLSIPNWWSLLHIIDERPEVDLSLSIKTEAI